jgi:hypothetical protein
MSMSRSMYIYVEMPECRTVRHPVSPVPVWKKLTMPEQVQYRTKVTQSSIFFSPVPDQNLGCQNADAGVSFHDADAQLCPLQCWRCRPLVLSRGVRRGQVVTLFHCYWSGVTPNREEGELVLQNIFSTVLSADFHFWESNYGVERWFIFNLHPMFRIEKQCTDR